jgi:hypothetical protein
VLPKVLADRMKFLGTPNNAKKKKPNKIYLSDLCSKYKLLKTGKREDIEKRLLVHFFSLFLFVPRLPILVAEYYNAA